ncbi:MAG: hypothetical protein QW331_02640 [Candidatus Woesearchaeota archaeon]
MDERSTSKFPGAFVVTAGIDCSGKGTIIRGLQEWAIEKGLSWFDLREYEKKHHRFPSWSDISYFDVILSAEPHYAYTGAGLREEIISTNSKVASSLDSYPKPEVISKGYSARSTAQVFASDREIAYKRLIIPALESGKIVFQERSVESSLVYQPTQAMFLGEIKSRRRFIYNCILTFEGNLVALLDYPANALLIATCSAEEGMKRKERRDGKKDDCIFETIEFQRQLKEIYEGEWFRDFFKLHGTDVIKVDTSGSGLEEKAAIELSKANARAAWEAYLAKGKVPAVLLR